jgi:N-methylhydantoinase A
MGYIRSGELADGDITVDLEAARRAIYDRIAKPLGLSLLEAAEGVHRIANAKIMRALRAVSTERGRDTRDFALIAFGGSGPIHAAPLARELSIDCVVIPPLPGLLSSLGLLSSAVEHHDIRSCLLSDSSSSAERIAEIAAELKQQMLRTFAAEGFTTEDVTLALSVDVRFQGQSSELRVPITNSFVAENSLRELRMRFETEYERFYGHCAGPADPIEVVAIRLVGRGKQWHTVAFRQAERRVFIDACRPACFGGQMIETPVVSRVSLSAPRVGPLLVDEYDSTTVIPPGMSACVDDHENLLLRPCND